MNSSTILEIYRITLLSNVSVNQWVDDGVLEVYRMTLRSNVCSPLVERKGGFRGLQNYTTLKLA